MTDDPFDRAVDRLKASTEREDAERRTRHEERVAHGRRLGFRIHATVYVAVQLMLVVIWATVRWTGGPGFPWFIFPLLGWGIGLAAHYAAARDHLARQLPQQVHRA